MVRAGHGLPINLIKMFDIASVVVSFGLATVAVVESQNQVSVASFLLMRTRIENFFIFLLSLYVYHLMFCSFGLYRSRRMSTRVAEILDILKASACGAASYGIIGLLFSIRMLTSSFLITFWGITAILLCGSRVILRPVLARVRTHGRNLRYVLILGTNARAVAFGRKIEQSPERGYRVVGFVDDDWSGISQFHESGFRLACSFEELPEFLRTNLVDEAVIYLPLASFFRHCAGVENLFAHHGIIVRLNSDVLGFKKTRWIHEEFDGNHYIATYTWPGEGWPLIVKRTVDLVASAILLVLLAPLFLIVAVAIKLTSPGAVFFLQERIGLNKRRFRIYKFRTMVPNAEKLMSQLEGKNEISGPVFKIKNDPRITPVGRFLRRSSIDELPQLLNVLRGEMSLVGPRPLPVRDYQGFSEDWQRRRFSVMPGITCLWQVNGRSGIPFQEWMRLDLQYMDEWSLWLDLKILLRTVPAILRGSGAA
jgi:exopolysaccharide biosynthesis polyprenyl glycosylphosphotransferase